MSRPFQQRTDAEEVSIDEVASHELPPAISDLARLYDERVGERDEFLWKWLHVLLPHVTLSSVPPEFAEQARDAKTVASMFVVLLDDLGEKEKDRVSLDEASKVPFTSQEPRLDRDGIDHDAVVAARTIWEQLEETIADAPRREEFDDIFRFDLAQTVSAIDHSYLVNDNLEMANLGEIWSYDCHNMMMFTYLNLDLMYSPSFDRADLAAIRETTRQVQKLARIGNWVTTWERELPEGDFTSGVVVYALEQGIVSVDQLQAIQAGDPSVDVEQIIADIKGHEAEEWFLGAWADIFEEASALGATVDSINVPNYLEGMETVLQFHLASRGLK